MFMGEIDFVKIAAPFIAIKYKLKYTLTKQNIINKYYKGFQAHE